MLNNQRSIFNAQVKAIAEQRPSQAGEGLEVRRILLQQIQIRLGVFIHLKIDGRFGLVYTLQRR